MMVGDLMHAYIIWLYHHNNWNAQGKGAAIQGGYQHCTRLVSHISHGWHLISSLIPRPHLLRLKGLGTLEQFFGLVHSTILILLLLHLNIKAILEAPTSEFELIHTSRNGVQSVLGRVWLLSLHNQENVPMSPYSFLPWRWSLGTRVAI